MSDYTDDDDPTTDDDVQPEDDAAVEEAGTPGNPTDPDGPHGSVSQADDAAPRPGEVANGPTLTINPSGQGELWHLEASGDYAGDEGVLVAALRDCLAGFGVQSATFTSSWGEDYDVTNPHI